MKLFPVESAAKLGLDVLFSWLVERVYGEATLRSIDDIRPFSSVKAVSLELATVDELQQCLKFDDPLGVREFDDIRDALARASARGAALDSLELRAVASTIDLFLSLQQYVLHRRAAYPNNAASFSAAVVPAGPKKLILESIDEQGEIRDSASQELKRIRRDLVSARNRVREAAMHALALATASGYAAEDQPTIRGGRLVIPVRAEAKRKIKGFIHDVSASGQTVYIEPESALNGNNEVRELEAEEGREIFAIRVRMTDSLREALPEIRTAFSILTGFDVRLAKARLGNTLGAVVPEIGSEGVIRIQEGKNPALMLHFLSEKSGRKVVPFSVELGLENLTLIISGPNAGGKSVTMKSVGLMALMIAHGLPIPVGDQSRFDLFETIFVDIGDEQSISDDLSTFTSHLKILGQILSEAGPSSLVLIDEAGAGTDPEAGGALARAVLEKLLASGARTIVTTHYGPLKVFAHETERVMNGSMIFDQAGLRPTFEFVPGVPGSSYAAEIAERAGLSPSVIERAKSLMGSGHTRAESLIADLMNRNANLAESLEKTEQIRREVSALRDALDTRLSKLKSERDQIRTDALRRAEDIVQQANRTVEGAIRDIKESGASKSVTTDARKSIEEAKAVLHKEVQRVERKSRSKSTKERPKPVLMTVGDRVRLEGAETIGDILSVQGKQALVAFGSVQMKLDLSRLVRVSGKSKQEVKVRQSLGSDGGLSVHSVQIRLDIRGKRVEEAYSDIMPFLDKGIGAGLERAEILHGTGTGALRMALHELLTNMDGIRRFEEAPLSEGGAGVTIVYFK